MLCSKPAARMVHAACAASLFGVSAHAQSVTLTPIASPDTEVHVLGNKPALHGGTVAFYGYRGELYGDDAVVATAPADGSGGYTVLVAQNDPRPDVPGAMFDSFGNPSIFEGRVVFLGDSFGDLSSTYTSVDGSPFELLTDSGIANPFVGPNGVSTPASPSGIAIVGTDGSGAAFYGTQFDANPCGGGMFTPSNVQGLFHVPQGGAYTVWPARVTTLDFIVAAHDSATDTVSCVAGAGDAPAGLEPFESIRKADTDGQRVVFVGSQPGGSISTRYEGVFVRDISGAGEVTTVAYTQTPAPGGGEFRSFGHATIDGDLVIFHACAGATGCTRSGLFGCYLDGAGPGEAFEIVTTADTLGGRSVESITMAPSGRDGDRVAFDARHNAQSASLYVASVSRDTPCPADLAEPFGVLDLGDVQAFIQAFLASDGAADLAPPEGVLDLADLQAFASAFVAGCP